MSEAYDPFGYGQVKVDGKQKTGAGNDSPDDILFDAASPEQSPGGFADDDGWEAQPIVQFEEAQVADTQFEPAPAAKAPASPAQPSAPVRKRREAAPKHPELLTPVDTGRSRAPRPRMPAARPRAVAASPNRMKSRTSPIQVLVPAMILSAGVGGAAYFSMIVHNPVFAGLAGALGLVLGGLSWFFMRR